MLFKEYAFYESTKRLIFIEKHGFWNSDFGPNIIVTVKIIIWVDWKFISGFGKTINYSGYGTEKSNYELNKKYYFYYKN